MAALMVVWWVGDSVHSWVVRWVVLMVAEKVAV